MVISLINLTRTLCSENREEKRMILILMRLYHLPNMPWHGIIKRLNQAIATDGTSAEAIYQSSRESLMTFDDNLGGEIQVSNTQCKFDTPGDSMLGDRYVDIPMSSLDFKLEVSPTN